MTTAYRVVYTHAARDDLIEIGNRIREVAGPETAEHFIERMIATADRLTQRPTRQRVRPQLGAGIRALRFRAYLLFYRVDDATVTIIRVLHGRRDITQKLLQA